jgi:hypothetical protein
MSDGPERVWLKEDRTYCEPHEEGSWVETTHHTGVEYVRVDLCSVPNAGTEQETE